MYVHIYREKERLMIVMNDFIDLYIHVFVLYFVELHATNSLHSSINFFSPTNFPLKTSSTNP